MLKFSHTKKTFFSKKIILSKKKKLEFLYSGIQFLAWNLQFNSLSIWQTCVEAGPMAYTLVIKGIAMIGLFTLITTLPKPQK
jgi:hypothetical protein